MGKGQAGTITELWQKSGKRLPQFFMRRDA